MSETYTHTHTDPSPSRVGFNYEDIDDLTGEGQQRHMPTGFNRPRENIRIYSTQVFRRFRRLSVDGDRDLWLLLLLLLLQYKEYVLSTTSALALFLSAGNLPRTVCLRRAFLLSCARISLNLREFKETNLDSHPLHPLGLRDVNLVKLTAGPANQERVPQFSEPVKTGIYEGGRG